MSVESADRVEVPLRTDAPPLCGRGLILVLGQEILLCNVTGKTGKTGKARGLMDRLVCVPCS